MRGVEWRKLGEQGALPSTLIRRAPVAPALVIEPRTVVRRFEVGGRLLSRIEMTPVGEDGIDDECAVLLRRLRREHAPPLRKAKILDDLTHELGASLHAIGSGD